MKSKKIELKLSKNEARTLADLIGVLLAGSAIASGLPDDIYRIGCNILDRLHEELDKKGR